MPVLVGPPAPPAPTLVHFERNVVVRRGKLSELPDQLDTDNLDLVLVQADKTPPKAGAPAPKPQADAGEPPEQPGVLGDLTLQRVKATGHAVWVQLPTQGVKIRCTELLHKVAPPGGQNLTYFHGDATRKLMVEKYDFVEEFPEGPQGPVRRKPESITRVWTIDATLVDNGAGMESSNLFAHGPGLLETRPIPSQQDNALADVPPDRTVVWQDLLMLKNILGPDQKITQRELVLKGQPRVIDRLQQSSLDAVDTIVVWLKPRPADATASSTKRATTSSSTQGGSFQIERLLALRDVHLIAPSKNMTARTRLEADFKEIAGTKPATTPGTTQPGSTAPSATAAADEDGAKAQGETPATEQPAEPNMVAVADRVEANVLIDPNPAPEGNAGKTPGAARSTSGSSTGVKAGSDSKYDVRDLRMFGAVSLHQDPSPGKTKGQDATGEALILRNDGPGRAIFNLYHRDPRVARTAFATEPPRPRAIVTTDEMTIKGEVIGVNQQTDEAWVYGPGELVQLTDRGMMTDKAREPDAAAPDGGIEPARQPADGAAAKPKPATRAGRQLPEKVPLVITWAQKMLFHGRSVDTQGRPAAKAEFFKNARAEMEDGLLYCEDVMTTYTDRPVPLAELGKLSSTKTSQAKTPADDDPDAPADQPKADLAFIDLVGKAQAISRKVDPDRPVVLSRQHITGDRILYNRETGRFRVPGAGIVYLHDRSDKPLPGQEQPEAAPGANRRPIRQAAGKPGDQPGAKPALATLVLTQIRFSRELIGRFGTGKQSDQRETRWADFFGDIEAARAIVPDTRTIIDYDRPPADTYFLTSQTMRVVTEPPLQGAPRNAPARNFLKAWENAYAKTSDTMIQADVITYDSLNDLIYANGQEGRLVTVVQQAGPGQPGSPMRADNVRVNPKTGAADVIGPQVMQFLDKRTGTRPTPVPPPDPNAKPPKTPKPPYRPQLNNVERKGFTGR
jgi:hypothetical protein